MRLYDHNRGLRDECVAEAGRAACRAAVQAELATAHRGANGNLLRRPGACRTGGR